MENLDHAYIYSEGAVIDTNGLDATIAQNLESPSGSGIKKIDVGVAAEAAISARPSSPLAAERAAARPPSP